MNRLISILLFFAMALATLPLDAQKTFKAVCDRSDGTVKIIDGEDRSPNFVPLKGGFPFYQVAQNWVKENYPDGRCDPAAAQKQNQAAAAATGQPPAAQQQPSGQNQQAPAQQQPAPGHTWQTAPQQQPAPGQTRQAANSGGSSGVPGHTPARIPAFRYRNTSIVFSMLISDLGLVYNLDPPVVPGMTLGIDQVFGKKFYGGTGVHFNTLFNLDNVSDETSSFYFLKVPLFAGFRQVSGKRFWAIDMGVAVNTRLQPLAGDSYLSGETASFFSLNTHTRARFGRERAALEFGFDFWLNDLLVTSPGYHMKAYSIGYRGLF